MIVDDEVDNLDRCIDVSDRGFGSNPQFKLCSRDCCIPFSRRDLQNCYQWTAENNDYDKNYQSTTIQDLGAQFGQHTPCTAGTGYNINIIKASRNY